MKKIIILCLSIIIIQPVFAKNNSRTLNFAEGIDLQASNILYEYILNNLQMTPKEIEDFAKITKNSVRALKYDLNNDGEDEIIGMVYSSYCWGTAGYSLFILQKETSKYKNIAYLINFEPQKEIKILRTKNNSYYNIKFYNPKNNKYYKAKYIDKIYSTKIKYK